MMYTESGSPILGNWRAGAYGANRTAHLWTPGRKPACGRRLNRVGTSSVSRRRLRDLCYECLAYTGPR